MCMCILNYKVRVIKQTRRSRAPVFRELRRPAEPRSTKTMFVITTCYYYYYYYYHYYYYCYYASFIYIHLEHKHADDYTRVTCIETPLRSSNKKETYYNNSMA